MPGIEVTRSSGRVFINECHDFVTNLMIGRFKSRSHPGRDHLAQSLSTAYWLYLRSIVDLCLGCEKQGQVICPLGVEEKAITLHERFNFDAILYLSLHLKNPLTRSTVTETLTAAEEYVKVDHGAR
jgi:hypothetical protein